MSGKRIAYWALISIMVLQLASGIFFASRKTSFWEDDLYSLQEAHYYLNDDQDSTHKYFINAPFFSYGKWVDVNRMKDTFVVHEEESLKNLSVIERAYRIFKGRCYFGVLNEYLSLVSMNEFSIPKALYLNLVFLAVTDLFIYLIMRRLGSSDVFCLLAAMLFGFSAFSFESITSVRFYAMDLSLFLAAFYLNLAVTGENGILRCTLYELASLILLYIAMRNSEFIFVLSVLMILSFIFLLIRRSQFGKLAVYALVMIVPGSIYLLKNTRYLNVMFSPASFAGSFGRIGEVAESITTLDMKTFLENLRVLVSNLSEGLFGNEFFMVSAAVFTACMLFKLIAKREKSAGECIQPVSVMAFITAAYMLFICMGALNQSRYLIFIIPFIVMMMVRVAEAFAARCSEQSVRAERIAAAAVVFLSLINLFAFGAEYMDSSYDRFMNDIKPYADLNSIVVLPEWYSNKAQYECAFNVKKGTGILTIDAKHPKIRERLTDRKMLVWTWKDYRIGKYLEGVIRQGYRLRKISSSYGSDVYLLYR